MIIVIPYCEKDADLAIGMLEWIKELGGAKKYDCLLITDPKSLTGSDAWPIPEKVYAIQKLCRKNFKSVEHIYTPFRRRRLDGTNEWPMGANWVFYCTALFIGMSLNQPFLWLEPDCVPLKEGWLKALEDEYADCGKPFMGPILQTNMPSAHPEYMNGTAIYPGNALTYFDASMIDFLNGGGHAFDVASARRVIPLAYPTRKIQHYWGSDRATCTTFKLTKTADDLANVFTPDHLFPEAVLYHRVKDDSLISILRTKRNEGKVTTT
jgi:hypothetical protein